MGERWQVGLVRGTDVATVAIKRGGQLGSSETMGNLMATKCEEQRAETVRSPSPLQLCSPSHPPQFHPSPGPVCVSVSFQLQCVSTRR